jgi:hypothetical protein
MGIGANSVDLPLRKGSHDLRDVLPGVMNS